MTLTEIKAAVEAGKRVFWRCRSYEVIKDELGQWLIWCHINWVYVGLTWQDGTTLNGEESEFFICERS